MQSPAGTARQDAAPSDGPTPQPTGKASAERSPLTLVIAVVTLFVVIVGVSQAVIHAAGWDTAVSSVITLVAAGCGAAATLLVANRGRLGSLPLWMFVVAAIAVGVIVFLAWLSASPNVEFDGELTASTQSATHKFTAHAGDQYNVILTTPDDLHAHLRISNGLYDLDGVPQGGRLVVSDILIGGRWTIIVGSVNHSTGHYAVKVVHDTSRTLRVGDSIDGAAFTGPSFAKGYLLSVPQEERVYISLEPTDPANLAVQMKVLKKDGYVAANPRQDGGKLEVLQTLDPGTYVLGVRSNNGEPGSYRLVTAPNTPTGVSVPSTVPANTLVAVPSVVGEPQQQALGALVAAGVSPRAVDVCSHSVPRGVTRQVVEYDGDTERVLDDLGGVTDLGKSVPAGSQVVVKVGTGQPCA
jgi:hypothetical protein